MCCELMTRARNRNRAKVAMLSPVAANMRCRKSNGEGMSDVEVSGRARHSCARDRFGGQGTARPTCAAELMHVSSDTAVCGFNPL